MVLTAPMFTANATTEIGLSPNSPQHAGREGQQGHERQVDDGQGDEAPVDRRPVAADHIAAEEEREDQRPLVAEGAEHGGGVLGGALDALGHADLHHQQGHGDREHGVGEVHNPVEATVLAVARVAGR
jgi:hypothetical protein